MAAPTLPNPFQAASKPATPSPFATALSQSAVPSTTSPFSAPAAKQQTPTFAAQPAQQASSSAFQPLEPPASGPASNPFAALKQAASASTSLFGKASASVAANGGPPVFQSKPATTVFGQQPATFDTSTPSAQTGVSALSNPFLPTAISSSTPNLFSASPSVATPSSTIFSAAPSRAVGATPSTNFGAPTTQHVATNSNNLNAGPVSSRRPAQNLAVPTPTNGLGSARFGTASLANAPASTSGASETDYAKRLMNQLQKDKLQPPKWPTDPGNPANTSAIEAFWISYGNYRDNVRKSLVKAGLIDDPKVRKRLDQAIDFKGICEEMCPEYEKIERIFQHNVMMAEKEESSDGVMWPSTPLMIKALTRSSAGQEAPLPMDVRTVPALKRTLDHLIDNVLGDDSRLPSVHNFLWDRTRAIRRDFIFHSNMSKEEMLQLIYCLETITRFHATSLHLLSQKAFAPEGFDQRQEREQLSKALLSLLQAYDDCKDRHILCVNECEFRAYFILLNAHDPNFQHKVAEWGMKLWYESDDVQTAMTLAQAMQSVWDWRGPIKPTAPTTTALGAFDTFFRIVESPQVSYTMACLAEMHFVHVRRGILRNITRAYARARDSPKDLTIAALNGMLRFDTVDEAWDFVLANKLEFSSEDKETAYLVLDKSVQVSSMPIPQSFSQNLVERKRAGRTLPEALHGTVYEDVKYTPSVQAMPTSNAKQSSDMFVNQSPSSGSPHPNASQTKTSALLAQPDSEKVLGSSTAQPAPSSSLFTATPAPNTPFPSASPTFGQKSSWSSSTPSAASGIFSQSSAGAVTEDDKASLFQTTSSAMSTPKGLLGSAPASPFANSSSTTPTSSPFKPSESSNSVAEAPSVFTKSIPANTNAPTASIFSQTPREDKVPATAPSSAATAPFPAAPRLESSSPFKALPSPTPQPAIKKDLLGDFSRWYVTGDNGILSEFQDAIVEHLVRQTFEQFQHDEEERIKREEDEKSWAEALQFKTYNLRIKFFYKWRRIARERALDRRARQSRDELKAYRTVKRAEQRAAAEKAAAEEREREAEARRTVSKEVEFLTGLGYYDDFGASSRKRKATVSGEDDSTEQQRQARSASLTVVGAQQSRNDDTSIQEVMQSPSDHLRNFRPPARSLRESISHTVSRAKELFTSHMTTARDSASNKRNHRGSIGSMASFDDTGSISGDSIHSVQSMRSSFSPGGSQVAYYRRSVPGKNRAHSFFTRISSATAPEAVASAESLAPAQKVTNFMRYSRKTSQFGLDGNKSSVSSSIGGLGGTLRGPQRPATATASPSPSPVASYSASVAGSRMGARSGSFGESKVRSSYWRLRAMGMVQMPNKQYLHESLALPMLQDGKRFPGVGNYGLPPVPAWNGIGASDTKQVEGANEQTVEISDNNGRGSKISDYEETGQLRTQHYNVEDLRQTALPLSRKRLFSGGSEPHNGAIGAVASYAPVPRVIAAEANTAPFKPTALADSMTSPLGAKKLRVSVDPIARDTTALCETERVIREMREMADAMDQGRDWFKEQTDLMKSGVSAWDE
ncbi:actin cytoskeleton and mitosis protein [Sporothrix epigloea]|uniref:Actin cytoskeleton and mitosis protein n=1 Tax=Sporothrix epigloea TaxID=1892477 RepID=A0ABP0DIB8_9PEZI